MTELSPSGMLRDALARHALAEIPKLLTLLDRTPVSPTYGCFDRNHWHYRVMDFPCGMSQEFVLPLALAWSLDMPGNIYKGQPVLRAWTEAGIRFAARSAHADGSCDDYYPFERAAGAAAFSLFACLEAIRILGIGEDAEIDRFLRLRAGWLARHRESGRLSNHEALIVACLARMVERFGGDWEGALRERASRLLSWQSPEGWFAEYEGADPGYLSLTIGLIADADRLRPDLGLREPCRRAIEFLGAMIHPDGTVGGEYTSRATLNYFPHGLEIAARWMPEATALNERALQPLAADSQPCFSDDRIVGHHLWSWMLAWREWRADRRKPALLPDGRRHFPKAGLLVDARAGHRLYLGYSRGGAFKLFDGGSLVHSDTGPALRMKNGKVAVTHLHGPVRFSLAENEIEIAGRMAWAKSQLLTPAKSILLRTTMLTVGRFFPDLVRRLLQRILVTGRKDAPFRFRRVLRWEMAGWTVRDEIEADDGWGDVAAAGIGGFQTSVATVMARVWQQGQFQTWTDLGPELKALRENKALSVERRFSGRSS
ncbi:MAG: hypothetical protein P4L72_09075 [Parvibaculum sp.]|uniref:hypothetical protein n=1 Tax=Parvibaculum sp. TaxID=2024848 RepID=UPI00284A7AC4|nr:hypothetical protein [Parvibaculum sp.]MDR3499365.1 hypothetical protein [Parvibaculum sp.]